jgi:hypothetical protein
MDMSSFLSMKMKCQKWPAETVLNNRAVFRWKGFAQGKAQKNHH